MKCKKTNLIGPAAAAFRETLELIEIRKARGGSMMFLYTGAPGVGKSSLCQNLILELTDPALVNYYNGRRVGVAEINALIEQLKYNALFGDYHYIFIDEIDGISAAAADLFLELSEYNNVVIFATSNKSAPEFSKRFQSRFDVWNVTPPDAAEIAEMLINDYNIAPEIAAAVSENCDNDVRAAVKDAERAQLKFSKIIEAA